MPIPSANDLQPAPAQGLAALEQRLAHDLLCLGWPAKPWMPPQPAEDGMQVLDVAIIGAGQAGLAAAACLAQNGIHAVLFDRQPLDFEGPWATTARMETLRSPKELTGPALGMAALTFRAWFEAQWGTAGWAALDKIPRLQWMDYLRWYRRVLALDVRNRHAVTAVLPRADGRVLLQLLTPEGERCLLARRVVVATGRDGLGGPAVPDCVAGLDRRWWAHSSDALDHGRLAGLRVGVVEQTCSDLPDGFGWSAPVVISTTTSSSSARASSGLSSKRRPMSSGRLDHSMRRSSV